MSWHCLQEREAAFSVESYLAGIASERLKSRNTLAKSCSPANVTDSFQSSQSGMTCGHLTESPGAALSMSSAAASHAKTYPAQERESESTASAADSGQKCTESFARYDRVSHSWKTPQCSLLEGLDEFSETWPKQGMMRAGRAYQQQIAARPTAGKEYGFLLPTPTRHDSHKAHPSDLYGREGGPSLLQAVLKFPTPTAQDSKTRSNPSQMKRHSPPLSAVVMFPTPQVADKQFAYKQTPESIAKRAERHQLNLAHVVQLLPTPTCQDAKNNGSQSQKERNTPPLNAVVGGALNPTWVEWLMGWPLGWTALKPLETGKFQLWRQQHTEYSIAN